MGLTYFIFIEKFDFDSYTQAGKFTIRYHIFKE